MEARPHTEIKGDKAGSMVGDDVTQGRTTIVVATYNAAATLETCLRSCMEQDYPNKELIVVDGGSQDGTVDILTRYNKDIRRWVSEPDGGIYDAWNKALGLATGEWICFLGADDAWADAESLSKLLKLADFPRVSFVSAKVRLLPHGSSGGRVLGESWKLRRMRRFMVVAHAGALHHRSLFKACGAFDPTYRIAGDYAFLLRARDYIKPAYLPEVCVDMGGGGVSATSFDRLFEETRRALREHCGWGDAFIYKIRIMLWRLKQRLRPSTRK